MKYENVSLLVFQELMKKKKQIVKEQYNESLESFRREAIADQLDKIDFCLKELDLFLEWLADDENAQNEKHST